MASSPIFMVQYPTAAELGDPQRMNAWVRDLVSQLRQHHGSIDAITAALNALSRSGVASTPTPSLTIVRTTPVVAATPSAGASIAPQPSAGVGPAITTLSFGYNNQRGATYTVQDADNGKLIVLGNAAPVAVTLPQAGTNWQFMPGWFAALMNLGPGAATITPNVSTVDGAASFVLEADQGIFLFSIDGQYVTVRGLAQALALEVNGVANGSQLLLNLKSGNHITLTDDGVGGITIADSVTFEDNETVAGTGTAWTLAHAPSPVASLILVQIVTGFGGITLISGVDYTLTAGTGPGITTTHSLSTGALRAWYRR